ncbi:MAG: hypothetical protein R3C68_18910 [Myxococcota bacterium]
MLAVLQQRITNDRPTEIQNAAAEQAKITALRLKSGFNKPRRSHGNFSKSGGICSRDPTLRCSGARLDLLPPRELLKKESAEIPRPAAEMK